MAKELELKYGCNPNQKPAKIFMKDGELPIQVLCGKPGFINFLDAFNAWHNSAILASIAGRSASLMIASPGSTS